MNGALDAAWRFSDWLVGVHCARGGCDHAAAISDRSVDEEGGAVCVAGVEGRVIVGLSPPAGAGPARFTDSPGLRLGLPSGARVAGFDLRQMPAYQAYPASGDADPRPLPKPFIESVAVRRTMYFRLL